MKTKSDRFLHEKEIPWEPAGKGINRQIMGYDGQLMVVKVHFETGVEGAKHEHYHSQTSYVVSGKFKVTIDNESQILGPGDGTYVAPDELHGIVCLEEGIVLDIFSPHRSDFLK